MIQDSDNETRQARRVTWTALGLNLLLAGLKLVCGLVGTSQALIADSVHSLSDSSTDLAILIGVRYWHAPADDCHPHGHRRVETVITVMVALALAAVAVGLALKSLTTIGEHHDAAPGWSALAAALACIVVKEAVYRWTMTVGKRINSPAVIANAWHHRSDALSSVPVALAVIGAKINPDWGFLDHVGAVVVSVFILGAAWRIGWPALQQLVDAGAPFEDLQRITEIAFSVEPVRHVHAVRTRYVGSGLAVDLHVKVDGSITVREGHDIAETVKRKLLADGPDLVDVVVHLEPCDEENDR
jgi:cation diffusion facilitator family transporter